MSASTDTPNAETDGSPGTTSVVAVLRRLPRRVQILLLADGVNAFGLGTVLPFLFIYLSQVRHINVRVAAAALAVTAVASFGSGLVWGSLLDRYRHRIVMPAVMGLAALGSILYAFADRAWIAIAVAVVVGIASGGVGPVIRTLFATAVPQKERTVFFGLQFGFFNGAVGLGVLVGGLLVNGTLGRYQLLYAINGITFLVMAAVLLVAPGDAGKDRAPDAGHADGDGDAAAKPSYRTVLRNPVVLLIIATMSLAAVFYYGLFESVLPGYVTINHAVSARGVAGAFVVNLVVVVLVQFVVIPRLGQVRRTTWLTASGLLWGVSWLLVLFAGQSGGWTALTLYVAASVPFAAAEAMVTPVLAALLNDIVDDRVRGRANALFAFAVTGGSILGPAVAAALLPVANGVPLVAVLAAGCLLMLVPTAMLRRRLGNEVDRPHDEPAGAAVAPAQPGSVEPGLPAQTASA